MKKIDTSSIRITKIATRDRDDVEVHRDEGRPRVARVDAATEPARVQLSMSCPSSTDTIDLSGTVGTTGVAGEAETAVGTAGGTGD